MSRQNETIKTITVAGLLCAVCSIVVSLTVVTLKPRQAKNAELDYKKNILMAAGLIKEGDDIEAAFEKITPVVVDFATGMKTDAVDASSFDQNKASKDPKMNVSIPADLDVGGLSTRAKYAKVFLSKDEAGNISEIILNVRGKGLWSTMYGFIALAPDTKTIKGFAYYSQGETPGLGGEVDNPNWKKQWIGKRLFDDNWNVAFEVAKGTVDHTHGLAQYKVDGLSGATITGNGVTSSMKYWFGDHGYGKFLAKVRAGEF
jgi:Na+-transporting NADH:ubiquinone oxidoreductase subunit C